MIQVVCCAHAKPERDYYLWDAFHESLQRYGIKPTVLGWGEPWRGLGSKPKLLKRAIEDGTIRRGRIIFCDAFDVVFANDPWVINAMADPNVITWNAEKTCFPDASLAKRHPETASPFKYLNSGLAVGHTDLFREALRAMNADGIREDFERQDGTRWHANDQDNWMLEFLNGEVPMALDHECRLFQTICGVSPSELDLSGPVIRNLLTGECPLAFHFNGPAKTDGLREPVLRKLNLPY